MRFMQIESVLQTKNRSEPKKKSVFCSPGDRNVCVTVALPELKTYLGVGDPGFEYQNHENDNDCFSFAIRTGCILLTWLLDLTSLNCWS